MIKRRRYGIRVQNYHVRPVRYSVSGGDTEDDSWGARVVGMLYVVIGGVMLLAPALQSLGRGTRLFLSIFGAPATAAGTLEFDWPLMLVATLVIAVGVGIVIDKEWAYLAGMLLGVVLFLPTFPIGTGVACVLAYVLWQALPSRRPKTPQKA